MVKVEKTKTDFNLARKMTMFKKITLFSILLFVFSKNVNAEVAFQKVYEIPKMTAAQIKEAYGDPTIDVGVGTMSQMNDALNTFRGDGWKSGLEQAKTGKLRCNISFAGWMPSQNEWVNADVIFQVKDGRARITISNLSVQGPGRKQCVNSIDKFLNKKFSTLKLLNDKW